MKYLSLLALTALIGLGSTVAQAQDTPTAAERVDHLRLQLLELSAQEESAKLQAQQIDVAMDPENIRRSLAGVGSTRPEELREARRRELAIEKARVDAELQQLALRRSQLESALATAQADAYQESAGGGGIVGNQLSANRFGVPVRRLLFIGLIALVALGVCLAGFLMLRSAARRNTI